MKKSFRIILAVFVVILVFAGFFYYYFISSFNSNEQGKGAFLANPVAELSDEEAIAQFNESFVAYLLLSIGAQNLHNAPFSSDTPKIGISVDELRFHASIIEGILSIGRGAVDDEDILISTTRAEAVKMLRDRNYIVLSFQSRNSDARLIADKTELFGKGYFGLYNRLTE